MSTNTHKHARLCRALSLKKEGEVLASVSQEGAGLLFAGVPWCLVLGALSALLCLLELEPRVRSSWHNN